LIVVVILTTLVAAALPIMAPSGETRRLREGARSLNTMITAAQTKATELGRPFGIWLEKQSVQTRRAEDRGAVMNVFYCEQPPPFAGFDEQSVVIMTEVSSRRDQLIAVFGRYEPITGTFQPTPIPPSMFRPHDRLVVHDLAFWVSVTQGPYNRVDANGYLSSTDRILVRYNGSPGPFLYVRYKPTPVISGLESQEWTHPQPYTMHRQPQKVDDPLQLPAGIAIDLEGSGDRSGFFHDPLRTDALGGPVTNDTSIAVLFSPGGAVHSIIRNTGGDGTAGLPPPRIEPSASDGAIYLLVAKRELVGESQLDATKTSWLDPESLWVSIAPQTGRIISEENYVVDSAATVSLSYDDLVKQRLISREFAQKKQNMGGR
jgi:hypothetical protein